MPHDVLTLRRTTERFFEIFLPRDSTLFELLLNVGCER